MSHWAWDCFYSAGFSMTKPCPMCKGRTPNNVFARLISGPCDYCGGKGVLETEKICKCGRPAVFETKGILHCTRVTCGEQALKIHVV